MQIKNCSQNKLNTTSPSFNAIKSVKCKGLYKTYLKYNADLIDTFKRNPDAMDFCKKYEVDIIFDAQDDSLLGGIVTSFCKIKYVNPAKSKFLAIFGSLKDSIIIACSDSRLHTKDALKGATDRLKDLISPTGINRLKSEINIAKHKIDGDLIEKQAKKTDKICEKNKKDLENKTYQEEIKDAIEDLINCSKA